jgi:hypothetical protein
VLRPPARPAAPRAALVTAIMKNPANTIDCTATAGKPDVDCGYGFLLAERAVAQALDPTPPGLTPIVNPAAPNGKNGFYTSNVAVAWNVSEPGSPIAGLVGCGSSAVTTDGSRTLTCAATSAGGTATRSVTIRRDASPPTKPKIKGIKAKKYKRSKLPKKSKIKCTSSDPTSGVTCKVRGYSKKKGKRKLTATATNGAGLISKKTLKYRVR